MKRELRKAIREYYQWNGDKKIKPVKLVENERGVRMALVRLMDSDENELSSLMSCFEWGNGKWDVWEMWVFERECEDVAVEAFMTGEAETGDEEGEQDR